jgi:hypothetical protein
VPIVPYEEWILESFMEEDLRGLAIQKQHPGSPPFSFIKESDAIDDAVYNAFRYGWQSGLRLGSEAWATRGTG